MDTASIEKYYDHDVTTTPAVRTRLRADHERVRPRKDDVREAIRSAADEHFLSVGYREASLDQIARMAGFTKGAIYSNFSSKPALFLELLEERFGLFFTPSAVPIPTQQDPAKSSLALATLLAREIVSEAQWHRCVAEFALEAATVPDIADKYLALRHRLLDDILTQARTHGISVTAEKGLALATALLALVSGYSLELGYRPDTISEDDIRRALQGVIMAFIMEHG